jgi:MFS family permease
MNPGAGPPDLQVGWLFQGVGLAEARPAGDVALSTDELPLAAPERVVSRSWRHVGRSMRNPNFRRYLIGQGISNTGNWMQQTTELWLILELTGSGAALGLYSVFRHGPVLLLGVYGGLFSDRADRRHLLLVTQVLLAAIATTLAVASWVSTPTLILIYFLVAAQGLVNAVDNPLRRTFIRDLTDDRELSNAISLHSTMVTLSRTIGPAVAGLIIASVGVKWSFTINALSYMAVIGSLLAIDKSRLRPSSPVKRGRGQLREGFEYAWRTSVIRNTLMIAGIVSVFAWNWHVLLPGYSISVFEGDAALYGVMVAVLSVGSFVGAIHTAKAGRLGGGHLFLSGSILSAALLLTAAAPGLLVGTVGLILLGASGTSFIIGAQARLQLNVVDQMSGRVMALWSVVFLGSRPIGGVLGGWIMDVSGVRAAFAIGGAAVALTLIASRLLNHRFKEQKP